MRWSAIRKRLVVAVIGGSLLAACNDGTGGLVPTTAPGVDPSSRATQNVPPRPSPTTPNRSFVPVAPPDPDVTFEPLPLPSWVDFPSFPTFPPHPSPSPTARPDLELVAMFPATLGGRSVDVQAGWAADFGEGGDMCSVFCPGELQDTARKAGAAPDDVSWAFAYVELEPDGAVLLRAVRVPDAKSDLVAAWVASSPFLAFADGTQITVDGRKMALLRDPFGNTPPTYAWAADDVLIVVTGAPASPDPAHPTGAIEEAIAAFPG